MRVTQEMKARHAQEQRDWADRALQGGIKCACNQYESWQTSCGHTLVIDDYQYNKRMPAIKIGNAHAGSSKYPFVFDLEGLQRLYEQLSALIRAAKEAK